METFDKVREETDEICSHCAQERREQDLPLNRLVRLAPTALLMLEVLVCPTCDNIGA